jgi:hypothetical protein
MSAASFCYQVSISPTFYEQLLHQNHFAKKLQKQLKARKSCAKKLSMKKLLIKYW